MTDHSTFRNRPLALSGILALLYCGVHVFAGGPEIHGPAIASDLEPLVKGVFSVVWHGITAMMLLSALALLWLSGNENQKALGWLVVFQFFAMAALFVFYGISRFGDLTTMPQWTGFLVIGAVAAWGLLGRTNGT